MILNFTPQTEKLNAEEKKILPKIIKLLAKSTKKHCVTSIEIIAKLKSQGYLINGARLRKIINCIRNTGMITGLLACNKGYYVSNNVEEIRNYIQSLKGRIDAITVVRKSFEDYLGELNRAQRA